MSRTMSSLFAPLAALRTRLAVKKSAPFFVANGALNNAELPVALNTAAPFKSGSLPDERTW